MKVILRKNVDALGEMGDVVTVTEGYARNYLIPYKFAFESTADAERQIETLTRRRAELEARRIEDAKLVAAEIAGGSVSMTAKADGKKLYGAIHEKEIADAATQQLRRQIVPKMVVLSEAIKEIGEYRVKLMLDKNVEAEINVTIVADATVSDEDAAAPAETPGTADA
jgi:large subunit ribosomal protein L9